MKIPGYIATFLLMFMMTGTLYAQEKSLTATYLDSITEDEEGNKLLFPHFVFEEPVRNEIYVVDGGAGVIIYTSDFFPVFTLTKSDGIEIPQGLTVDKEGNLYLAQPATKDNPRHRISVFNACLKWERDIYFEGFEGAEFFSPNRLAVDEKGNIYVAGNYMPGVLMLNNEGGFMESIAPEESGRNVNVNYVTIDRLGRLLVVSEGEGRVYVYDENRKFLFKFGEKGGSTGKLSRPQAVAADKRTGRMYVVDYMRHTISAYDEKGKYLYEFGGLGWGEGWFQYPKDIAVDREGRIFVADTFNNRVQVFRTPEPD